MGQRGPKPVPSSTLKLRGSWRGNINKNEPKPKIQTPRCPSHITGEAKREWKRIVPELKKLGLLTRLDRAALAGYCQSWARLVKAEKMVEKTCEVLKSPSGYPIMNPWLSVANKALKQVEAFVREFGLSPSSRTRVEIEKPEEPNELDNLLFRRTSNG